MKVAMVITSYHPIVGGAERQLAQLAGLMQAAGHHVTVITRHHAGLSLTERVDGVRVWRIPAFGPKPLRALSFLIGAARAIKAERPDVVHCHSLFSPALAGVIGGAMAGVPVIAKPMCGGEASEIAARPLGRLRMWLFRKRLARIVSISREITAEITGLGFAPSQIAFIPNGVDAEKFHPLPPAAAAEKRRGLGLPDGVNFVFAGRFAAQKRVPMLLRAFTGMAASVPKAHLLIAGANRSAGSETSVGGEDETGVPAELLAHPQVKLLGQVNDMPALLAAADAFVLPSAREGLSNALLEACAAGLPAVAARIGGTEDVIADGENGLLFETEAELAECLRRLATDDALRARLGPAARATVMSGYDIRQTAHKLLDLYRTLRGGRP